MRVLLDTSVCSRFLGRRDPVTKERLHSYSKSDVFLCSVVKAELFFGLAKGSPTTEQRELVHLFLAEFESLPFDDSAAAFYGPVRAQLEAAGNVIGPNDLMIASIALANDLTLATYNGAEFGRVSGLAVEDWNR